MGTLGLEKPWYNRTVKHPGFPEKGAGEYWYDYKGFYFVGNDNARGLLIPSDSIIRVSVGFWHGLTFSRAKMLKIVWRTGREKLCSGFVVSYPDQIKQALTATGWA